MTRNRSSCRRPKNYISERRPIDTFSPAHALPASSVAKRDRGSAAPIGCWDRRRGPNSASDKPLHGCASRKFRWSTSKPTDCMPGRCPWSRPFSAAPLPVRNYAAHHRLLMYISASRTGASGLPLAVAFHSHATSVAVSLACFALVISRSPGIAFGGRFPQPCHFGGAIAGVLCLGHLSIAGDCLLYCDLLIFVSRGARDWLGLRNGRRSGLCCRLRNDRFRTASGW